MHYLYRITNQLNQKVYIGQSNNSRRWSQHKYFARNPEKTGQYIHRAMAKYGIENFIYEVIATCLIQDDANITEDILIKQYDSRNKEFGYNLNAGGFNGEHSEETKEKIRQATINQIATQGHPAQDNKWTDEQKANLSISLKALDKEKIYTEEVRQHMSEAHIGIKDSEKTKQKKSESAKVAWDERIDYSRKCEATGCDVHGKAKYKIIEGVRYCNMHGLRMLRNGNLESKRVIHIDASK
jgi:group I intron endonuclease